MPRTEQVAAIQHQYGLDRPVPSSSSTMLKKCSPGTWGPACSLKDPSPKILSARLPATMEPAPSYAMLFSICRRSIGRRRALRQISPARSSDQSDHRRRSRDGRGSGSTLILLQLLFSMWLGVTQVHGVRSMVWDQTRSPDFLPSTRCCVAIGKLRASAASFNFTGDLDSLACRRWRRSCGSPARHDQSHVE